MVAEGAGARADEEPEGATAPAEKTVRPATPSASSEATRHVMQANKSKDTKPELKVRAALREAGYPGYRLHWKKAPGHPDICYPGRRVAIFVNGCYWHRCPYCALPMPKSNVEFWQAKFDRNRERDARNHEDLVLAGWTVVVVWECRLKKGRFESTMEQVVREVARASSTGSHVGRLVEVGSPAAWQLSRARRRYRVLRG